MMKKRRKKGQVAQKFSFIGETENSNFHVVTLYICTRIQVKFN